MFTDVTNILFVYYQGQKTMYHKNMFGNGSTYYRFTKVLCVIWWTENSMPLQCVEYRAPFVPAILPGSMHMCCIAMELGVATPITIYHTATSFSVDWLHAYNI